MVTRGWSVAIGALVVVACGRGPFLVADADGGGDGDGEDDDDDVVVESSDDAAPPEGCDFDSHEHDEDGDDIPDADDPFCDDRGRPGRARTDVIYAHSPATLYTFDPDTLSFELVGPFVADGGAPQVTDIAIDRFGVLYAVTFGELHACDPTTAECWPLAPLATNSLGFVPFGAVDDDDDVLVTVAGSTFTQVVLAGPNASEMPLGTVSPYSSSGDVASIRGGSILFTSPWPTGVDAIVQVDPSNGSVLTEVGAAEGSNAAFGLAGFDDELYIFDQLGQISRFDPFTRGAEFTTLGPEGWWGAATHPDAW